LRRLHHWKFGEETNKIFFQRNEPDEEPFMPITYVLLPGDSILSNIISTKPFWNIHDTQKWKKEWLCASQTLLDLTINCFQHKKLSWNWNRVIAIQSSIRYRSINTCKKKKISHSFVFCFENENGHYFSVHFHFCKTVTSLSLWEKKLY